jgi:hypothetical protein
MGLNIILASDNKSDDSSWFDTSRFSWDKEFASAHLFTSELDSSYKDGDYYDGPVMHRIFNTDLALKWISENVGCEGNKERLIKLVTEMDKNKNLYIEFSY